MQRDASFDILKGMAIILVVVGHAIDDTCLLWRVITSVHMPLFFLVSGYFFHITPPLQNAVYKDFRRLVVPYACVALILAFYVFCVHCVLSYNPSEFSYLAVIVLFNKIPFWFLLAMFWARLLTGAVMMKCRYPFVVLVVLSLLVTFVGQNVACGSFLCLRQGVSALVFMVIGMQIRRLTDGNIRFNVWLVILMTAVWALAVVFASVSMIDAAYHAYVLAVCGAVAGTYVLLYVSRCIARMRAESRVRRFLVWFGANTLIVLCAHTVDRYITVWRFLPVGNVVMLICLQVVLYAAVVWLCHRSRLTRAVFFVGGR